MHALPCIRFSNQTGSGHESVGLSVGLTIAAYFGHAPQDQEGWKPSNGAEQAPGAQIHRMLDPQVLWRKDLGQRSGWDELQL